MAETLEILVEGCKRNDRKSQKTLYDRFSSAMYALCLQYASSEEDARDILQEGFIKVFSKIEQLQNPEALPGWIRRVMINTALEKYRSEAVLRRIDDLRPETGQEISNSAFGNLTSEEIIHLITSLTPQYRMVFNLYAVEGYSHKEISQMLGISEGTSKSNLSRARVILQQRLKKIYGSAIVR